MAKKPKENKEKVKAVKRLKARGFAQIDNTATGLSMGLVDSDGFFQKVVVTRQGKILRYGAIKARKWHRQTLPKRQSPLRVLPNGNLA